MPEREESHGADLFDFVDEYLSDREKGREHPLAHYLARYPRIQEAVAREYLAFRAVPEAEPLPRAPEDGAGSPPDPARRVGPYRILSEIGRGGQGAVFLAEDTRIARRVALKVLASRFDLAPDERRRRFRREAEVIARLEHPGICGIFDADIEGDTPYIAMRLVEGHSLAQILTEARANESAGGHRTPTAVDAAFPPRTPLEVRRVLHFFERVARALHAAHEAGVVHRDVKPGNVLVGKDGAPVLLDFGLARDEQSDLGTLTQSGDVFGTPAYMSPEQLTGGGAAIDRRTDVYSLAASLHEALTLSRPYEAPTRLELCRKILEGSLPDARAKNSALSEDIQVVLETALEPDRERRYPTALDFAEDLRRIREYEPIRARPAGVWLRFSRWTRRHPVLAVAIIGSIAALSGGLALALHLLEKRDSALEIALGRHLAGRCVALIPEDPALALAIGIEAADHEIRQTGIEKGANYLTRSALFDALDACWLERTLSSSPGPVVQGAGARVVRGAAVSPDGRRLALASTEVDPKKPPVQVARVFDLETGQALFDLPGVAGEIREILYSPDGARIVAVESSAASRARVHDARDGSLVREMDAGEPLLGAAIGPDGARLAAVGASGRAYLWDLESGERRLVLDQGEGGIAWAAFDPRDASRLLTRAASAHAKAAFATLWDAATGRAVLDLAPGAGPIAACAFDPAHDRVALGCESGALGLFETAAGTLQRRVGTLNGPVRVVSFSPDGSALLAATDRGDEGQAVLLVAATGEVRALLAHEGRRVVHGAFSPDGRRFATASFDRTVRVWDAASGAELRVLASRARPIDVLWTPDGQRLVTLDSGANVWFARNRPDVFDLAGHTGPVVRARFAPDGRSALTASADGTARLWSVPASGSTASADSVEPGALLHVLRPGGAVNDACFSRDGTSVLTAAANGTARLWSTRTGAELGPALVHPAPVLSAALDPAAKRALTLAADGRARVFDLDGAAEPRVLESSAGTIVCASFDATGELVACGTQGGTVEIRDAARGERRLALAFGRSTPPEAVTALAFAPLGDEIAVSYGTRIGFRDRRTGADTRPDAVVLDTKSLAYSADGSKLLVTGRFGSAAAKVLLLGESRPAVQAMVAHNASITGGALSADGALVLTFARDGTAHVWEAATGRPVAYRSGSDAAILDGSFDAGGGSLRVITARADGTVSVWPVDPLPAARARRPRALNALERDRERRLALPLRFE